MSIFLQKDSELLMPKHMPSFRICSSVYSDRTGPSSSTSMEGICSGNCCARLIPDYGTGGTAIFATLSDAPAFRGLLVVARLLRPDQLLPQSAVFAAAGAASSTELLAMGAATLAPALTAAALNTSSSSAPALLAPLEAECGKLLLPLLETFLA